MTIIRFLRILALLALLPFPARADGPQATPAFMGTLGLNTVPSARMDPAGTVRAGTSFMDPYLNAYAGIQLAAPLYIAIRQTAEFSSLRSRARALYPGVDLKLRLREEGPVTPQIAFGLQSAFGAARMAGEYFVLSKRWSSFDFTGGLGWGRLGSAGHLPNPFSFLGPHFRKNRPPDGPAPRDAGDWFTGKSVGLFGGVEYFPAFLDKVSLKLDWNADGHSAEKSAFGYDAPQPWSVGFAYRPTRWLSLGTAFVGGNKVMAMLSLQEPLSAWPHHYESPAPPIPLNPARAGAAQPAAMERAAATGGIDLYNARDSGPAAWAMLAVDGNSSLPQQIGRAARPIANNAGAATEEIAILPVRDGLTGPAVILNRRDLESAMANHNGSPAEIWRDAVIGQQNPPSALYGDPWTRPFAGKRPDHFSTSFRLTLDNDVSLTEKDSGILYRTSLLGDLREQIGPHLITGGALRLNIENNLEQLSEIRLPAAMPVRSNVAEFAGTRVEADRLYAGWLTSLAPGIHFAAAAGLLEEMYSGAGAEFLYRPFGKNFAIGMEGWSVYKRDPLTPLALGSGYRAATGHLNAWYEIPATDLTVSAKIGRYLAGDAGGTLGLERLMDNGVKIRGFITATNKSDTDIFGRPANLYSGVELALPLGDRRYLPNGSAARLAFLPLGRDSGQTLDNPLPLHDLTEPFSARQINRHWNDLTE